MLTELSLLFAASVLLLTVVSMRGLRAATVPDPEPGDGHAPISVVLAARNEAARIGALIDSVLAQDHPDFELVVVDDRSTDKTLASARAAAAGDPRVRFLRVDELPPGWQGRLYALSVGVAEATREWLLFLSADQRLVGRDFLRSIVAEYDRRGVEAASVLGPFVGNRWWQTFWLRPVVNNPVLLGCIYQIQRHRARSTWLIGAVAMRARAYQDVGGAAAAAFCGAGVFDDWGWTRVFELRRMRTAMVYHPGLQDVSNWETFGEAWNGLSRWVIGIMVCRRGAPLAFLLGGGAILACSWMTVELVADLVALRLPGVAALALAAVLPTIGIAYCRAQGHRVGWAALGAPVAFFALAPLAGALWAWLRNRVLWRGEEIRVLTEPPEALPVDLAPTAEGPCDPPRDAP